MHTQKATSEIVLRHTDKGVAYITLNNPHKFNALSEAMIEALQAQLDDIAHDPKILCVLLAANGRGFCAGHDLKEMRAKFEQSYYEDLFNRCSHLMQSIVTLPIPVIAKVQGLATAAGCQLVASCDLAIASRGAKFAVSGINAGLFCSTPSVALSRNISTKRAFDMLVTGDVIDAETALDWGLISALANDDDLDNKVDEKIKKIISKSPAAIRHGKAMFYKQRQLPLMDAYELAAKVMAENMMCADASEGIDAFIEKREPIWQKP